MVGSALVENAASSIPLTTRWKKCRRRTSLKIMAKRMRGRGIVVKAVLDAQSPEHGPSTARANPARRAIQSLRVAS
jgi:hypothetical protein